MNPYLLAVAAQQTSNVLGNMVGGAKMSSANPITDGSMNNSGWTVALGGSTASAVPTVTSAAQSTLQNPVVLVALVIMVMAWRAR
ncbi:hypothetical protein [Pandoraea norimbergensis]|uniref:Uncharacterized protein n=1 Tax=Pandoraea norimbergensis TaxID=93219 RepID=A0ABN4JLN3_9BURK|nr:hypothetical protein [Pandoraea norimbergensis]ALS61854.1 hypothetical protein AT302_20805 [Pandoraea norimbergensis]